jgi:hypothetical protein
MKRKPGFWIVVAIAISLSVGLATHNIPAGICIGPGTALLMAIAMNIETDRNKRN